MTLSLFPVDQMASIHDMHSATVFSAKSHTNQSGLSKCSTPYSDKMSAGILVVSGSDLVLWTIAFKDHYIISNKKFLGYKKC